MIIFDLDGTLADCEHRRHFVDRSKYKFSKKECFERMKYYCQYEEFPEWKPDWKAFYEACDQDTPILPVIQMWNDKISLGMMGTHQIWSGRCESVREKIENWLEKNILCFESHQLKMRPIGDNTPDDQLKEKWLDELINSNPVGYAYTRHPIDFVFDSNPASIKMWRRRGIFVFNCAQNDKEF